MKTDHLKNLKAGDYKIIVPFLVFYSILTIIVSNTSFFGDAIQLGSQQAHWFYENDFRFFFLPEIIDSGHPPLFGFYLAIVWKVFGKSLYASHFSILPFLFGIVFQLYFLLKKFFNNPYLGLSMVILLVDPTLLAQSIGVSPDIPLFFFFLSSLNAIFNKNRLMLSISLLFLAMISMRGMMHVAILFVVDLMGNAVLPKKITLKHVLQIVSGYLLPAIIAGAWLFAHYKHTGWIGYHENSPWAVCFQRVDTEGIFKNIFILGWRLIDFGRIFVWIIAVPIVYLSFKKKLFNANSLLLFLLFISILLLISPNLIIHAGLLAHRYLLTVYFSFTLFVLYQLQLLDGKYFNFRIVFIFLLVGLGTGNLWRYPSGIAQGWDSTLAHYPYDNLRKKMLSYIREERIPMAKIGSSSPNTYDGKFADLSDSSCIFKQKNVMNDEYILYSNVFNGFSDTELDSLKKWKIIKTFKSITVDVTLYKNPFLTDSFPSNKRQQINRGF